MNIPFNKPAVTGYEMKYINEAIENRKLSGDGPFNKKCSGYLKNYLGALAVYITPSCTAASEMASIIIDVKAGDEVIMPSFTFTSTANAVAVYGGVPVFVDVRKDTMNIDENLIEAAITDRTKAIAPVHYAGVGCEMDAIMTVAKKYNLVVIEDDAQGMYSSYKGKQLGTFGDLGAISFHETKNIIAGEGGALIINADKIQEQAEIIREKGTDRSKFFRGEIDKYSWIHKGSSYLLSELGAAYLYAQLEHGELLTKKRLAVWDKYYVGLQELASKEYLRLPFVPDVCKHNGHMFYILLPNEDVRESLRVYLKDKGIGAVSHYVPLHSSKAGRKFARTASDMSVTDNQSLRLLRLPMFADITDDEVDYIINNICIFLKGGHHEICFE